MTPNKTNQKARKQKIRERKIRAWAFLASGDKGEYFIGSVSEIYFKKPPLARNPFTSIVNWKPTQISITLPQTLRGRGKKR